MKLMVFAAVLLLNDRCWSSKAKVSSVWPKTKVTLSDSYLPAVTQLLTYLLDKIDEQAEGTDTVQVVLLSPPPAAPAAPAADAPTAPTAISILSTSETTVRTDVVDSEDVLKENAPGLKPARSSAKPSVEEIVLGRLRDILILEAKRQRFQKIQGYSRTVLDTLRKTSHGTAEEQLKTLIELMLKHNNVKRRDSLTQASLVLEGLNMKNSNLQKALANIPPLLYTL